MLPFARVGEALLGEDGNLGGEGEEVEEAGPPRHVRHEEEERTLGVGMEHKF